MNVEFYKMKSEKIPTKLRLLVDGEQVDYWPVDGKFAYDFEFTVTNEEESLEIAKELAQIMCDQSYDHGQSWRVTGISIVEQDERYAIGTIVRVNFRIRDSH